ncbi:integral membrane protein [Streptomyces viridochromogenes DSM 40736]|uniref:Integral membrane protein n=2 Tax=Streptomyces viridochromogenes TaxID=1938 RepID=D9WZL8_STRVT|nr:integral membrane protein [Streptomyces viridochromogenes DSM 40736]
MVDAMRKQHGGGHVQVFRITGARAGLQDDVRGRQRRYVISMTIRTISVILAATLWNVERHVAIVALVLGLVLPYIAVVIANAGRENAPSLPSTFIAPPVRPMITPPGSQDGPAGSAAEDAVSGPVPGARTESGER